MLCSIVNITCGFILIILPALFLFAFFKGARGLPANPLHTKIWIHTFTCWCEVGWLGDLWVSRNQSPGEMYSRRIASTGKKEEEREREREREIENVIFFKGLMGLSISGLITCYNYYNIVTLSPLMYNLYTVITEPV